MNQPTDIRWQQRFVNYQKAFDKLKLAISGLEHEPTNQLYQMALIQTFEFTFELGWKVIKDYLKYNGVDARLPREAIKEGFAAGIIEDGQLWIDMMNARNSTSHSYDETIAAQIVQNITSAYVIGFIQLAQFLQSKF